MSAYATLADLVERFGAEEIAQLTDETAATSPDSVEVGKQCDEASSLIDAYLSTRYTTPVDPAPTIVRKWACDIARYSLYKGKADPNGPIAANYKDALAQLRDVAKGVMGLPDATGVTPTSTGGFAYTSPDAGFDTTGLLD